MVLLVLLCSAGTYAQEQLTIQQRADKLFERYQYSKALSLYFELVNKNKIATSVLEHIAGCYRNMNRYDDAEKWYSLVIADPKAASINHYYYAEALQRNRKFALAKKEYQIFYGDNVGAGKLKLAACDSAAAWIQNPLNYRVFALPGINTPYADWGLSYGADSLLVFTSDRLIDNSQVDDRTGNSWFRLYQSRHGGKVERFDVKLDSARLYKNKYHIGPIAFNNTNDTAYVTVTTDSAQTKLPMDKGKPRPVQRLYSRRMQLLVAVKQSGYWLAKGGFPYNNVHYSIGHATLTSNGRLIYFTSDMPGGEGKTDIWYCEKQPDGKWGKPINCGKNINTKEEDEFPFIQADSVLYYSSTGLLGMGGYDIYKTKGNRASWAVPQNLKYPINTTGDDFYLVTTDGLTGYLSSNRSGGKGNDDIYAFAQGANLIPLAPPIAAALDTVPVTPQLLAKGEYVIKTIYYDVDKSLIRPDAATELDRLAVILKDHPKMQLKLSSYCDSRASYKYNLSLSKRRAKAAVLYLVSKGVLLGRIAGEGYGKTRLLNQCATHVKCPEADHQLNRRTEFKLSYK